MPSEAEIAVVNAGQDLVRCANAIVGADPYDTEAQQAFDMFTDAKAKWRVAVAALSAASAVRSEPSREELQRASDAAYVRYINLMQSKPCLGFEAKLASGTFGVAELKAHCEAAEYLGRHRALAALLSQPEPKGDKA